MPSSVSQVSKILSANDLGLTGSHQAGILVPKDERILRFFPRLPDDRLNPSKIISCSIPALSRYCEFRFIYYNNKIVGGGTRNEYRLTRMTASLRDLGAHVEDILIFSKDSAGRISLELDRRRDTATVESLATEYRLQSGWKIVMKEN